jgi:hypothetical protein
MNRLQGGYQQGMIRAAKQGTALFNKQNINRAKLFVKNGNKLSLVGWPEEYTSNKDFVKFLKTCPEDIHVFSDEYNVLYDIWESIG